MAKISVIIPVYKVEQYLHRCLESVLAQTYADLEVILVDDGSPDSCGAICDEYAQKDSRITVIHQENRGLSGARNAGLDIASGEYISFVDSDDAVAPRFLQVLSEMLEREGAQIAECGRVDVYDDSLPQPKQNACETEGFDAETAFALLLQNRKFHQTVWNKLYVRDVIGSLRFPEGKLHEDEFFTWQVFLNCEKTVWTNNALYFYYHRPGSIMETFSSKRLDLFEARLARHHYIEANKRELEGRSKQEILLPCIFTMQTLLRQKDRDMKARGIPMLKEYYQSVRMTASEKRKLPAKLRLWIGIADHSLTLCARIRNGFDRIRRGDTQ